MEGPAVRAAGAAADHGQLGSDGRIVFDACIDRDGFAGRYLLGDDHRKRLYRTCESERFERNAFRILCLDRG